MAEEDERFQQVMDQGHSAAWDQDWEEAAELYRQAVESSPQNPQGLTHLGLALIELQEYDKALECYQNAAKIATDDPLPLEKCAQLYEQQGKSNQAVQASLGAAERYLKTREVRKAIDNWERAARLDPENLQAHSRLALVYERLGEKPKAAAEYLTCASILQGSGRLDQARQAVEGALKVLPESLEARRCLNLLKDFKPLPKANQPQGGKNSAGISGSRQKPEARSEKITAEPELDPISSACQNALAVLAGVLFDMDEGESLAPRRSEHQTILTGAVGLPSRPKDRTRLMLHLSQVIDLQARGDYARAADELQRAVEVGMEHPAAFFDLGYLHAQAGRMESAIKYLQNSVKNADYALGSRLLLGELLLKKGRTGDASFEYLQALKLADVELAPLKQRKELVQLYELLIESQRQQNDPQIQERLCGNIQGMLARPDWRTQLQRARKQLPGQGEKGLLIPLGEVFTQARSSQVIESVSAIYEMIERGLLSSAMEEAYYALELAPAYLPMHAMMGEMLYKQGDYERAVAKYQVLGRAYAVRNEMPQAIQYFRKVVELAPADLAARTKLIDELLACGQVEEAIEEYARLAEVHYNQADRATARRTYLEAFQAAQQANADRALKVKLLHRVADIDMQILDWRQAARIYQQIRSIQPDDEEACRQIIQLNLRLGQEQGALAELDQLIAALTKSKQPKKLVIFLERLGQENPEQISIRRRLVDAYLAAGLTTQAVAEMDRIAEMLLQSGDRAGAIQLIEKILTLEPPDQAEYRSLLSRLRTE